MKKLMLLALAAFLVAAPASFARCIYCNSTQFGPYKAGHPTGYHVHMDVDPGHCIYCNGTQLGRGCPYGPNRTHKQAYNNGNCVYCGSSQFGHGCPFSPSGQHER